MISIRPSTEYDIDPNGLTVFDCRWNTKRRIGIGDKLIAIAAIQQIGESGHAVAAACNPPDAPMFAAAGINMMAGEWKSHTIPWTDHPMCVPLGTTVEDCIAADSQARHPVERALWGIGLDRFAQPTPAFKLRHQGKKNQATLSWSPIEISRAPNRITPAEWEEVLDETIFQNAGIKTIELLCAVRDQPEAWRTLLKFRASLAKRITIRSASGFEDWINRIASAGKVLTANTGAMWAAIGVGAYLTVCQRPATFPHMAMWQARREWGLATVVEYPPPYPLGCPYSHFQPLTHKTPPSDHIKRPRTRLGG